MDTGRNEYSTTFAAVYSLRHRRGAPVSAPCTWEEVESGVVGPQTLRSETIKSESQTSGTSGQICLVKGSPYKVQSNS
jgi:bifunctional non-homologous end joining protein LigD